MPIISEEKILAYSLKNAVENAGSARSGSVLSGLFAEGLKKSEIKNILPKINIVLEKVNSMEFSKQEAEFEKIKHLIGHRIVRDGLPELPNSEKGIVMRFAPSASGPLHIMHGIVASLSYDYVKKYGGKLIFRIEDTNPENILPEAYDLLKADADFLFCGEAQIFIQSDRMKLYYEYSKKLIEKEKAYLCTCSGDEFRQFAKEKKECPCRNLSIKENIKRWEKMLKPKGYKPGQVVLRFKSNMKHKNPALRDFPLARINLEEHPRQKNKYLVWPLMNLSVAVDDIEMNLTHIIRGKDHRDNAKRQELIFEVFNKKYPWAAYIGRYHFKDMILSTSQFRAEIEEGKYSGWNDSKLPTVSSLKKRGYNAIAFHKMAEHIGLSEVDKTIEKKDFFKKFDSFNE